MKNVFLEIIEIGFSLFIEVIIFNKNKSISQYSLILQSLILSITKRLMITKCQTQTLKYIKQIAQFSGKFIYRKGDQHQCSSHQALKYSLVEMGYYSQDSKIYIGVCAPQQCNEAAIQSSVNSFLEKIKSPLDINSVRIDPQNFSVQMNWVSFLTLFILVALFLISLVSTFRKNRKNIFSAFDISKHLDYFKRRQNEALNIFDGVRAISMMWVIFGHVFLFYLNAGITNGAQIIQTAMSPFFLIIEGGVFSVDVFFMLGGFFLSYVFLKQNNKTISFGGLSILQRMLRIWPAYIVTMLIYSSLFMQSGSGIFWNRTLADTGSCSSMWTSMLFISNLVGNGSTICVSWSWYLQVEFQLFLLGVVLLFVYYRSKLISFSIALILSIGSTVFVMVYSFEKEVKIYADFLHPSSPDFYFDVYIKPQGRCTPYILGLILGVLYSQYKKSQQSQKQKLLLTKIYRLCLNRRNRIAFEWFGIGLLSLVVFVPRTIQTGSQWPQIAHTIYWGFARFAFAFGTILVILPTILGHKNSFFNLILTSKILQFIARVSFCTYLIHLMVIFQYTYTRNYDVFYSIPDTFVIYLGLLVVCLFLGLIMTIFIELPFAKLQKQLIEFLQVKTRISPLKNQSIPMDKSLHSTQ